MALAQVENYLVLPQTLEPPRKPNGPDTEPDVILINAFLQKDAAGARTREAVRLFRSARVIVFGVEDSEADILNFVEAGASGYVLLGSSLDELKRTIDLVNHDQAVCPPQLAYTLFSRLAELSSRSAAHENNGATRLTLREEEILELIAEGLSNKQIASKLFVSLYTVKNHVHNILEKLQVRHRWEAVEYVNGRRQVGACARN